MEMGIDLSFFDSTSDLLKYLDEKWSEARALILSHTKRIEQARRKLELTKQGEVNRGSKRSKSGLVGNPKQLSDIKDFKVLVNPSAEYELTLLDEAIRTAQERLEALEKARKEIVPVLSNSAAITAIFDNGVPIAFMYHDISKNE